MALLPLPPLPAAPTTPASTAVFQAWVIASIQAIAAQHVVMNENLQTVYSDTQRTIALLKGEE
jgi:hypothetical protein